jgi:hypothetical protein
MNSVAAFAVFALAGAVSQEKGVPLDNPQYAGWKDFKVGSWMRWTMVADIEGQKMEMEETVTLLEVTAERVVLEHKGMTKSGGQEHPSSRKEDILPKTDLLAKYDKTGEETIEVSGKKLACQVYLGKMKPDAAGGFVGDLKFWINKDVPGSVVRMEVTAEKDTKPMTAATVSWEKK